jgi:hypothetical protein
VVVLTPEGGKCIGVRACESGEHAAGSRKAARLFGSERVMLTRPCELKGPSGSPVRVEETCTMIYPLGGPHERRLEIPVLVVDMLEQYCGFPQNSMWKWEMQLGEADAGSCHCCRLRHQATASGGR